MNRAVILRARDRTLHSSNNLWLQTVHPRIGIVSTGATNTYGSSGFRHDGPHPQCGREDVLDVDGEGVDPEKGMDVVGGTIIVEVPSVTSTTYTVRPTLAGTSTDTFQAWITAGSPPTPTGPTSFAWSKKSNRYHDARCRFVANISPANLQTGTTPPPGKTLHKDCPL